MFNLNSLALKGIKLFPENAHAHKADAFSGKFGRE